MSRYENFPLKITENVEVEIKEGIVKAKGAKGELSFNLPEGVGVIREDRVMRVNQASDKDPKIKSSIGLAYKVIGNIIEGVNKGFQKVLVFSGVGYRMSMKGKVLNMQLGFSHDINYTPPEGVEIKVEKSKVVVQGIDKELVGRVADKIKRYRPIEPYKGKGIKYENQHVHRKAGKAGAKQTK